MNEYEFPPAKIANIQVREVAYRTHGAITITARAPFSPSAPPPQSQLERLIEKNYYLNSSARDAYRSYVLSYASHSLKHIFNVNELDLVAVAKGFGFEAPPRVNLNIRATGTESRVAKRGGGGGFGDQTRREAAKGHGGTAAGAGAGAGGGSGVPTHVANLQRKAVMLQMAKAVPAAVRMLAEDGEAGAAAAGAGDRSSKGKHGGKKRRRDDAEEEEL